MSGMTNAPTWNMSVVYEKGVTDNSFVADFEALQGEAKNLKQRSESLPLPSETDIWASLLNDIFAAEKRLHELWTFTHCHTCADTQDKKAQHTEARIMQCWSNISSARIPIDDFIAFGDQQTYEKLASHPSLAAIGPGLNNVRAQSKVLLPKAEQDLAERLSTDGIMAWSTLYSTQSGKLEVDYKGEKLSPAQTFNRMNKSTDASERRALFDAYSTAWSKDRDLWATGLTHITGTRQTLNDLRKVSPLADVLSSTRMSEKTLDAMMEAIAAGRPMMVRYLKAKARALGLDKLGFQDLRAPLGRFATTHTWENSREFVLNNFKGSSEALYKLAKDAFDGGWIEAEDRSHKRQGGWCAFLPIAKQSRIFMTHGGGFSSTITLAHELGHAYHNEAMRDLHSAMRQVPMTLAETASTFAESVVRDAALQGAVDDKEKLAILDARLSAAMSFLMDIPSRFSFEKRLHELREEGPLDADKLDETMIECQREWFGDALGTWSPTFWASKLHFHMGGRSFYNFPYSFGYLFSRLVYAQVKADPIAWATKYDELLCDTGWMTAEELSLKHLGLDLTTSEAWTLAITPLMNDLEQFESLI